MKTVFMGGRQAGVIGLLTLCATGNRPLCVVYYSDDVKAVAEGLGIPRIVRKIRGPGVEEAYFDLSIEAVDLLVSVHGREIVSDELLALPKYGGINVHPFLSDYPGAGPVRQFIKDYWCSIDPERTTPEKLGRPSVGVHRMTSEIDGGEILVEEFVDIAGPLTVEGVYNALYPHYATALIQALGKVEHG